MAPREESRLGQQLCPGLYHDQLLPLVVTDHDLPAVLSLPYAWVPRSHVLTRPSPFLGGGEELLKTVSFSLLKHTRANHCLNSHSGV